VTVWDAAPRFGGEATNEPLVVGHRGGRGEGWPRENTMAAFDRARAEGARAVELDVRTWEGRAIVLHDAPRAAADVPADAPTLDQVLAWARAGDVAVNVEMKHDVPDRASLAHATVRVVRDSRADVLFSSFDPLLLAMAAALAPGIPRALLVHSRQRRWADLLQAWVRPPIVTSLHLERTQTDARIVRGALRRGLRVGVWTVNDAREARDLVALGVATIITDQPGAMLEALTPRR
jgi:glycerophosphoryl diester phosphodiesterase